MRRVRFGIGCLILGLMAGCGQSDKQDAKHGEPKTEKQVGLKVLDFDGIMKLVKSHTGKIVVVDCWSTT